jgi:hypothetical protein
MNTLVQNPDYDFELDLGGIAHAYPVPKSTADSRPPRPEAILKLAPLVRESSHPQTWARYRTYIPDIQKLVLSLRSRGMAIQRIQNEIRDRCGVSLTASTVASIRKDQLKTISEWRSRKLSKTYDVVYWNAIRVKTIEYGLEARSLYIAVGIAHDGALDVLGVWLERRGDTSFWMRCMDELRAHGVCNILIGLIENTEAFVAVRAAFPASLAFVLPPAALKKGVQKRKLSEQEPTLRTLPDMVQRFLDSVDPFKALIAKLRRGGFSAITCFRNSHEAVDLAVVILRPTDIAWTVQPSSWAALRPDFDSLYLQRNIML